MKSSFQREVTVWLVLFILAIIALGYSFEFVDSSNSVKFNGVDISVIILVVFMTALVINLINLVRLILDYSNIEKKEGLIKQHWENIEQSAIGNRDVSQDFSLEVINDTLLRRESVVQVLAGILTTLGMIGTIFGLITSLSGLADVMQIISNDLQASPDSSLEGTLQSTSGIVDNLNTVFSGMSSAFNTTILGAILGGIILRLMHNSVVNVTEILVNTIKVKTEFELLGYLQKTKESRDENIVLNSHHAVVEMVRSLRELEELVNIARTEVSFGRRNIAVLNNIKIIKRLLLFSSIALLLLVLSMLIVIYSLLR